MFSAAYSTYQREQFAVALDAELSGFEWRSYLIETVTRSSVSSINLNLCRGAESK